MGAVQKLATVVIIGLVALATVLTIYIANEPSRRDTEAEEQQDISIVRGTELYITFCLQCHGPAGLGVAGGEENPRIGPPLNSEFYQSDDPVQQQRAESLIRYRVLNGAPSDPRIEDKVMPAFRNDLSDQQINDLVTLILRGDWNYVYNQSVLQTGQQVAQDGCRHEGGEAEECDHIEAGSIDAPPVYPTSPPPEVADPADTGADDGDGPIQDGAAAQGDTVASQGLRIEAIDPYDWSLSELVAQPGDTITAVNTGSLQHDFTVDELGIHEDLPTDGSNVTITIPEDAEPGTYEFYCSVPGHREGGMYGTLVVEEAS